ncbi:hypothetical protein MMC21_007188 [Puttea exsequens]|nr:hypothetical protein [Puttea exsequens]
MSKAKIDHLLNNVRPITTLQASPGGTRQYEKMTDLDHLKSGDLWRNRMALTLDERQNMDRCGTSPHNSSDGARPKQNQKQRTFELADSSRIGHPRQEPPTPPASELGVAAGDTSASVSDLRSQLQDQELQIKRLETSLQQARQDIRQLHTEREQTKVTRRKAIDKDNLTEVQRLKARIKGLNDALDEAEEDERALMKLLNTSRLREEELIAQLIAERQRIDTGWVNREGERTGSEGDMGKKLDELKDGLEGLRGEVARIGGEGDGAARSRKDTRGAGRKNCVIVGKGERGSLLPFLK